MNNEKQNQIHNQKQRNSIVNEKLREVKRKRKRIGEMCFYMCPCTQSKKNEKTFWNKFFQSFYFFFIFIFIIFQCWNKKKENSSLRKPFVLLLSIELFMPLVNHSLVVMIFGERKTKKKREIHFLKFHFFIFHLIYSFFQLFDSFHWNEWTQKKVRRKVSLIRCEK